MPIPFQPSCGVEHAACIMLGVCSTDIDGSSLAADEALGIVHGPLRVGCRLVLGGVANQALCVSECHVRGGDAVALVVGDDLHPAIFVHPHT